MWSPAHTCSPLVEECLVIRKMRYHVISMCCGNYAAQFELRNLSNFILSARLNVGFFNKIFSKNNIIIIIAKNSMRNGKMFITFLCSAQVILTNKSHSHQHNYGLLSTWMLVCRDILPVVGQPMLECEGRCQYAV